LRLQTLHLLFKLLIAILQLLDIAGEVADRALKAVQPRHDIGIRVLRAGGTDRKRKGKRSGSEENRAEHRQHLIWWIGKA
jgi:hypothetical protein